MARGLITLSKFVFALPAVAQVRPDRTTRLVVNFGVGGAPDVMVRHDSDELAERACALKRARP